MASIVLYILALCGLAFLPVNGDSLNEGKRKLKTCERDYVKIGCFEEKIRKDILVNERHDIRWKDIAAFMHHFACICSEATKKANKNRSGRGMYVGFALHYWGECYGKTQVQIDFLRKGNKKQTHKCTGDQSYTGCRDEHKECVGHNFAEYVYELKPKTKTDTKIDGGYSKWLAWTPCQGKCGMGTQLRERTCTNPEPVGTGKDCSSLGETTERRPCDTGKKCPVDGGFSKWSAFSACSKSCGGGTMTKTRKCNNPAPANGGKNCVGVLSVTEPCKNDLCPVSVNGGFSKWSAFSACSKSCGGGTMTKTRKCNNPAPANGGKNCVGVLSVTEPCKNDLCPVSVNGGFSKWSAFGACSKACGGGFMTKTRKCSNPAPANGGKNCVGALSVTKPCKNDLCPGADGISKAQDLVREFLLGFHKLSYRKKDPSGKFHQATFAIQRAVASEFALGTTKQNFKERLNNLKKLLKIATGGGSFEFARAILGKSLFIFIKEKIADGLPIDQLQAASNNYLKGIKEEVGEEKFGEMLLVIGGTSLMFTVDTTGSMRDEIRAATKIANAIINTKKEFPVDYILSPFNDPKVGPVIYKNESNKNEFLPEIKKLRIRGGKDCREMAFGGMLGAFTANPKLGSPMFVFTDAGAKDDIFRNREALKTLADQYGSAVNFFTTPRGCGGKNGIKSYKEIAAHTSGQILPLKRHSEISKFSSYIKNSLKNGITIAKGTVRTTRQRAKGIFRTTRQRAKGIFRTAKQRGKGRFRTTRLRGQAFLRTGNKRKFFVDSEVKSIMVTVNSWFAYKVRYMKLRDGNGKYYSPQSRTVYTAIFNIDDPVVGQWTISFRRRSGRHTFIVKAFSEKTMDFVPYFLHQENKGWPLLSVSDPLSGGKSSLVLQVSGMDLVIRDSLKAAITYQDSSVIKENIALKKIGGASGIFQASVKTPSGKFKVVLSGTTKKGSKFTRLSRACFKSNRAVLAPISAGNEFTVSASKGSVKIKVYLYNKGKAQKYRVWGASTIGTSRIGRMKADETKISLGRNANKTASFTFNPPRNANSMIGKTFTVVITAAGFKRRKRVQTTFSMLFVP